MSAALRVVRAALCLACLFALAVFACWPWAALLFPWLPFPGCPADATNFCLR